MHLWTLEKSLDVYRDHNVRRGLRIRFEPGVDPEVRGSILRFASWIRSEYYFPIRVVIYVKASKGIRARDGEEVNGTFFGPYDPFVEPYIKVATGEYQDDLIEYGRDDALACILSTIAHELTHYYQWINQVKLTERGEERQAAFYSNVIIQEYATVVEHP